MVAAWRYGNPARRCIETGPEDRDGGAGRGYLHPLVDASALECTRRCWRCIFSVASCASGLLYISHQQKVAFTRGKSVELGAGWPVVWPSNKPVACRGLAMLQQLGGQIDLIMALFATRWC